MADQHIPWELIEKIQSVLPVKSLARFKCVCRSWNSHISSPEFMESYRSKSKTKVYPMFRTYSYDRREFLYFGWRGQDDRVELQSPPARGFILRPIGNSNGIICFSRDRNRNSSGYRAELVLWAPYPEESLELYTPTVGSQDLHSYAIGHHPDTHDLNLVQLISCGPHKLDCNLYSHQARKWRVVTKNLDLGLRWVVEFGWQAQSHSGRFHWIVRGEEFRAVVWFDVRSEELGVMDLPESLGVLVPGGARRVEFPKFGSYDGKLTVLAYGAQGSGHDCAVWVLEEYGCPKSWRELELEIELEEGFRVWGFSENFSLLLCEKSGSKVWYDVRTKRVTDARLDAMEADSFGGVYEETFFHLTGDQLYLI